MRRVRDGAARHPGWAETFGTLAAILLAFFVFLATLRFAALVASAHPGGDAPELSVRGATGVRLSIAAALRAGLGGERADLLDLFESADGERLVIRLDRSCDFEPGSDSLEFTATRLLFDSGAILAARGSRVAVAATSGSGDPADLASRRALAIASTCVRAGIPVSRIEVRAGAESERGGAIELIVREGDGDRDEARAR